MEHTRRDTLGLIGGAAAVATLASSGAAKAQEHLLGSSSKTLFWVASLTPCDKNLKFDPAAFKDMLAFFKHNGADGIVVLGTTGEFPSFTKEERKQVLEVATKNKDGMNIIVNPGTPNFPDTLELAKHAAANGADGLLVIPPFYYKNPPLSGLIRYYSMLMDQVHLPTNLYHIPRTSGVGISDDLLSALRHYPHLAGIKDSNGDPAEYVDYVTKFPDLNMRTGTGNNLEYALDHGMGAILAEGNVFTKLHADVFAAFRAGQDYHAPLAKVREAMKMMRDGHVGSYGPMKYALSLEMGTPQTYQRPPNADVTDAEKATIKSALEQIKGMG